MRFNTILFFTIVLMLFAGMALAQNSSDLPDIYYSVFSQDLISAILVVVGAVKLIRNLFGDKAKGGWAVLITVLASLLYGIIQFGFSEQGLLYGVIAGVFAALSFYLTKNVNKTAAVDFDMKYDFWLGLGKAIKYFLVRK